MVDVVAPIKKKRVNKPRVAPNKKKGAIIEEAVVVARVAEPMVKYLAAAITYLGMDVDRIRE